MSLLTNCHSDKSTKTPLLLMMPYFHSPSFLQGIDHHSQGPFYSPHSQAHFRERDVTIIDLFLVKLLLFFGCPSVFIIRVGWSSLSLLHFEVSIFSPFRSNYFHIQSKFQTWLHKLEDAWDKISSSSSL